MSMPKSVGLAIWISVAEGIALVGGAVILFA